MARGDEKQRDQFTLYNNACPAPFTGTQQIQSAQSREANHRGRVHVVAIIRSCAIRSSFPDASPEKQSNNVRLYTSPPPSPALRPSEEKTNRKEKRTDVNERQSICTKEAARRTLSCNVDSTLSLKVNVEFKELMENRKM